MRTVVIGVDFIQVVRSMMNTGAPGSTPRPADSSRDAAPAPNAISPLENGTSRTSHSLALTVSNGASTTDVLWRHALPNALLGATALIGTQFAFLMSGSLITEWIFAWPGFGLLLVQSVERLDFPVVQAAVFVIAGRKFLDSWREETPTAPRRRLLFGGLCLGCFLVVGFFEIQF